MARGGNGLPSIGVVGVGKWGKNHLRNFANLPGCRLDAVCDTDAAILDRVGREHPGVFVTGDFEALLARKDLDAVVIASSAVTHAPLGLQALRSGRDVFVEKPMALSTADAEEMARTAERGKRVLLVGHLLLYHPAVALLKSLVVAGELGDVHYLTSQRVNLGQIRKDENALWSFAPHDISITGDLFEGRPISVSARGGAYIQPGIEDVVFLNVKYPNQRMAHIHVSWLDPHKIRKVTLVGSRKMAVFDDMETTEKVRIYDKGVSPPDFVSYDQTFSLRFGDITAPQLAMVEPLKLECEHFLDCVRERTAPRTGPDSGVEVVRILEAGQRSLEEDGRPVPV
jgi:predicted dehydrogenase